MTMDDDPCTDNVHRLGCFLGLPFDSQPVSQSASHKCASAWLVCLNLAWITYKIPVKHLIRQNGQIIDGIGIHSAYLVE